MTTLRITIGLLEFTAQWEEASAPRTCAAFRALLPFQQKVIHARWSGEALWIPLGAFKLGVGHENTTSHPTPGQILLYEGEISETEILLPYGAARFASKDGQLAGNHFLTMVEGREHLSEVGRMALWEGAQNIHFTAE